MKPLLDPWDDAASISARLESPATRLIVVIGAEAWCEKCRTLRPAFDALARRAKASDLHLWLDLEEHAEFIGDYVPDDLPELLIYQGGRLRGQTVVRDAFDRLAQWIASCPAPLTAMQCPVLERLTAKDWAKSA